MSNDLSPLPDSYSTDQSKTYFLLQARPNENLSLPISKKVNSIFIIVTIGNWPSPIHKVKPHSMEQKELAQYWEIFQTEVRPLTERKQRIIAYKLCLLIGKDLDDLGKDALKLVEQLTSDHASLQACKACQEQLQNKLPNENTSPYSPLIWALMPHTDTYPAWYSAAIVGLNIIDLRIATIPELTTLTREILRNF